MGKIIKQYNRFFIKFQKQFKKSHLQVMETMPVEFSNKEYVERFKYMFPDKILLIEKEKKYWYGKRIIIKNLSKIQSKGMSLDTYNFILSTSKHIRKRKRENIASNEEMIKKANKVREISLKKQKAESLKKNKILNYIQEIDPPYLKKYRDVFFKTHDLHERLEIIRELSKYNSEAVQNFFYAINGHVRNQSLKIEVQSYFQSLSLPFYLSRKKKGKKNFIDNEIVKNSKGPDELRKRLYMSDLEKIKRFDVFLSHNSKDEEKIIDFFKKFNQKGQVLYIDWINDKYDLRREWCNASTVDILKKRIEQSDAFVLYFSDETLNSQWCPWELGYADALGKKICIYFSENINRKGIPKIYSSYPQLQISKNIYVKIKENEDILFEKWKNSRS